MLEPEKVSQLACGNKKDENGIQISRETATE